MCMIHRLYDLPDTSKVPTPLVSRASRSCPNWVYRSFSAHHSKIDGDNWGMSLPSNFSDGAKTWRHTRLGQRTSGLRDYQLPSL